MFSFIFSEGCWHLTCPAKYLETMSAYLRHHRSDYSVGEGNIVIKNASVTVINSLIKSTLLRGGLVAEPENPFE